MTFSEKITTILLANFSLIIFEGDFMENQLVQQTSAPPAQLKANFGLFKTILLSVITFGIYGVYALGKAGSTLNIIAGRYDGKKTMSFWLVFLLLGTITFGIAYIVWFHKISARIGKEIVRREIQYSFGAGSFWLWNVLGSLILVGPFVYLHKLFKAMNLIIENYNQNG